MDSRRFTHDADVRVMIREMKSRTAGRSFSDVVDAEGNQYVDLVMEGGGVLGISLLGYTYALESIGVRFLSVGGTSAGSISALLLAALDTKEKKKSEEIALHLANKNLYDFVDGDADARDFVKALVDQAGKFKLGLKAFQVLDSLNEDLGLNPGTAFLEWIQEILAEKGITRTDQLNERVQWLPDGLRLRSGEPYEAAPRVALIAAEVSTETKIEFPRMARLFWRNPDEVNPALYVRASMSIPFFFYPFKVENVPQDDASYDLWSKEVSFEQPPRVAMFMDGGIMSNFPIDMFHQPYKVPSVPTFGVKLGTDRRQVRPIKAPGQLLGSIFDSARHTLDYDFITRNPDYHNLLTCIDTGPHHWLNFELQDDDKVDLFKRGVRSAAEFVYKFDWLGYKKIRAQLAKAYMESSRQARIEKIA